MNLLLEAPIALVPVLAFVVVLLYLDSYDLVSVHEVVATLVAGAVMCTVALILNGYVIGLLNLDFDSYSRYVAPVIEECLKASFLVYLFSRNRIGFMIDAAIMGFSVGAGFAVVENIYLLYAFPQAGPGLWLIRGFGTAVMHSGATALFAMMAQALIEREIRPLALAFVPAILSAIGLHAAFNILGSSPLAATLVLLIVCPMAFVLVFAKSEHAVHEWLLSDYENHEHLLEEIRAGGFANAQGGRLFVTLSERFASDKLSDMFLYMQIHTELVLRSEKMSLAREMGEVVAVTAEDAERFRLLHALERKIGRTGLMTIRRHLHFSRRELWELNELKGELWRV